MKLLVSVTDAAEAADVAAAGAAIIDVKDPQAGPLGAARPEAVRAVRRAVPRDLVVSAALGDFHGQPGTMAMAAIGAALAGANLVKVGLPGTEPGAAQRLLQGVTMALAEFRPETGLIACAYADLGDAGGLTLTELPRAAAAAGCAGAMIDTYDKTPGNNLLVALTPNPLAEFVRRCRALGLICALAGALRVEHIAVLAQLHPNGPDFIGVRGAACSGGRTGRINSALVQSLARALGGRVAT